MNCNKADKLLLDYIEDNLPPNIKAEIESHLANCILCKKNLALTRLEKSLLSDTSDIPQLNNEFTRQVIEKIKTFPPSFENKTASRKPIYALSALAACLIMVLVLHYIPLGTDKTDSIKSSRIAMEQNKAVYDKAAVLKPSKDEDNHPKHFKSASSADKPENTKDNSVYHKIDSRDTISVYSGVNTENENQFIVKSSEVIQPETPSENMLNIKLTGLPDDYILQKTEQTAENNIRYFYSNNDNTIVIEIWPLRDEARLAAKSFSPYPTEAENNIDNNSVSTIKKLEDKTYNISISGNIQAEELNRILASIEIKKSP